MLKKENPGKQITFNHSQILKYISDHKENCPHQSDQWEYIPPCVQVFLYDSTFYEAKFAPFFPEVSWNEEKAIG